MMMMMMMMTHQCIKNVTLITLKIGYCKIYHKCLNNFGQKGLNFIFGISYSSRIHPLCHKFIQQVKTYFDF